MVLQSINFCYMCFAVPCEGRPLSNNKCLYLYTVSGVSFTNNPCKLDEDFTICPFLKYILSKIYFSRQAKPIFMLPLLVR